MLKGAAKPQELSWFPAPRCCARKVVPPSRSYLEKPKNRANQKVILVRRSKWWARRDSNPKRLIRSQK